MFQFGGFPTLNYGFIQRSHGITREGFPHSDICGSQAICASPQLFAAYRVLLRLLMPRHSPCALYSLTFVDVDSIIPSHLLFASQTLALVCAARGQRNGFWRPHRSRLRDLVLLNYAGNQQVTSQNCNCIPTSFQMFHN